MNEQEQKNNNISLSNKIRGGMQHTYNVWIDFYKIGLELWLSEKKPIISIHEDENTHYDCDDMNEYAYYFAEKCMEDLKRKKEELMLLK